MKKKYHIFKINSNIINTVSVIILVLCFGGTYFLFPSVVQDFMSLTKEAKFCFMLLPAMLFYFILHELLHALGYIVNGANPKKITFGLEMEKGVFYCLCKEEITRTNILISLMYPLFFIGIVTFAIGAIFHLPMLALLSLCNIVGAAGDIMYFMFIIRLDKDIKFSEMDDGVSFALIGKDDPSKYNHFGLDYVGEVDEISRKDFKRVRISKLSWIILILGVIGLVISIFV